MSMKPLSGPLPDIFAVAPSPLFVRTVATGTAAAKPTKAEPQDEVAFSAQALAALKSERTASTAAAAIPGGSAGDASGATTTVFDARKTPMRLRVDGDRPVFDPARDRAVLEYHRDSFEHGRERNDVLRQSFGLPGDIADGGGLALTGDITGVIDKTMALDGKPPPDKPAEMLAMEKERAAGPDPYGGSPPPSEAVKNTSMITLYLPGSQGTGSEQIEIMLDNSALSKLASMSADTVKKGLVDLMTGSDSAKAGNEAVKNGDFGAFMAENKDWHPEYTSPKARVAFFDPDKGADQQPMLMIQSESRPDYVRDHADSMVDAVMGLLRGIAPAAA